MNDITLPLQRRTLLGLLACSAAPWAHAQDKPLRLILPLAAGSVGDTLARGMAPHLSRTLGRPVVAENLPGAGGMTGTAQLVRAPADGSALALVSSSHVINPFIYRNMPYDAIKDITPVAMIGKSMMLLAVAPTFPAETVADFLQLLKANPGKYNYGSSGNGGVTHLPAELLNKEAGVTTHHIPYKGLGQQVTDMVGGQVEFGFVPVGVATQLVKAGKLRALAVTGAARSAQLPQVPTLKEAGLRNYTYEPWLAIIAPAGLGAAQIQRLHTEIGAALAQDDVKALMQAQDMTTMPMSPQEMQAFFQAELGRYGALVKYSGARAD